MLALGGCARSSLPPSSPSSASLPPLARVAERPVSLAHANGIDLAWDSFGDPSKPPLVLIMGLGMQMIAWDDDFCARLAARGYRVIRFDNRDVGQSTHLDGGGVPNVLRVWNDLMHRRRPAVPYPLDALADDVVGLLDALALPRAHLVGLSMGGMVAQRVAVAHPERVLSLTSIMSGTNDPDVRGPSFETVLALLRPLPLGREAFVARGVQIAHLLAGGGFPVDDAAVRRYASRAFDREAGGVRPGGLERQLAAILTAPSRKDALAHLQLPAMVVHGSRDPLIPVDGGRATAAAIPGARLDVVDGLGHEWPRAAWDRFIDDIAAVAK